MNFTINPTYSPRTNEEGATFSKCMDIPVSKIQTRHKTNQTRRTAEVAGHLADLKEHIGIHGLRKPIVVSIDSNGNVFVESGHHRFATFKDLKRKYIPCYVVNFSDEVERLRWLQKENSHEPALPHKQQDAVKLLEDLKELGHFKDMSDEDTKKEAFEWLNEFYPQLVGRKKGKIYESFLRGEGKLQYIEHTDTSRLSYAEKHGFFVKPSDFCSENNCFFVSANIGNAKKNCATINSFQTAPTDEEVGITAFLYTGAKNKKAIAQKRKEAAAVFKKANSRWLYPVKKIFFLPEILGETECEEVDL